MGMEGGRLWDAGNVLYLDLGAGYTAVINCDHSLSCTFVIGVLYCIYIILQ